MRKISACILLFSVAMALTIAAFSSPAIAASDSNSVTIKDLTASPSEYNGKEVTVTGHLMTTQMAGEKLAIGDESGIIVVSYDKDLGDIKIGDKVKVTGTFKELHLQFNAHAIEAASIEKVGGIIGNFSFDPHKALEDPAGTAKEIAEAPGCSALSTLAALIATAMLVTVLSRRKRKKP